MHMSEERDADGLAITAYGPGFVRIDQTRHETALALLADRLLPTPPADPLDPAYLEGLLAHEPEVVLLGTGPRLRFPHPRVMAVFQGRGIGCEVMDSGAACRTFNILRGEGRRVLAVILPP